VATSSRSIESFRARAWFFAVAHLTAEPSPYQLERRFQPHLVKVQDGKPVYSTSWHKYQKGLRVPSQKSSNQGRIGVATLVARHYPESLHILQHPLWIALESPQLSVSDACRFLAQLDRRVAAHYFSLECFPPIPREQQLVSRVDTPITILNVDSEVAFDLIASQCILLRLDYVKHEPFASEQIAHNLAFALEYAVSCPWISPFFEELYDYLEAKIWTDLFDTYQIKHRVKPDGWRKLLIDWDLFSELPGHKDSSI
jgi:hypothetical protein